MKLAKMLSLTLAACMVSGSMNGLTLTTEAAKGDGLDMTGYTQVWGDEFDGTELDRSNWNVELHDPGWVNSELQAYVDSDENIQVKDGNLYLNPVKKVETIEAAGGNLLENADFSADINGWTETIANWSDDLAKATRTIENGAITYDITQVGTEDWNVQLKQTPVSLKAGVTYTVSYNVTSSVARTIKSGTMSASYEWFGGSDPVLEAGVTTPVSYTFTMGKDCDDAQVYFSMGMIPGTDTPAGTVTLSDISLTAEGEQAAAKEKVTYTSGRINTQNKNTFTYGLFECRAKVPVGAGYLPAFWLMANDENVYGQWPRCGEIDCMEVMGSDTSKLYGTIHFGNPHSESQGTAFATAPSFSDDFHTFATEWEPGRIRWYVDGVCYHEESNWYSTSEGQGTLTYPAPFDQPFYIILNLAVGGSWVGNPTAETSFDNNPFVVDYVRVYQKDSYNEDVDAPVQEFNPRDPAEDGNYISANPDAWNFMTQMGGEAAYSNDGANITVDTTAAGTVDYAVQLVQANVPFEKGATYEVKFDASASEPRTMNVDIKAPDHGYKAYMPTFNPALTTETQTFQTTFVMKDASDENGRLEFNMGAFDSTASINISNVSIRKIADPDPNAVEEKTVLANGNYIYNGNFQEGKLHLGYWDVADMENVSVTGFDDGRRLKVTASTTISQSGLAFKEGTPYALSFDAQAETAGKVVVTLGGRSYETELTTENLNYALKIPGDATFTDQNIQISFEGTGAILFDNVKLVEDSMIKNGSFTDGLTGYEVYVDSSAKASYVVDSLKEDNALSVTVDNTGDQDWKIQIKQNNVKLEQGKTYKLSFDAKCSIERNIRVVLQGLEPLGWPVYSSDPATVVGPEFTTYTETFTMNAATDPNAFLSICLGNVSEQITDQHVVCIDNISLEEVVDDPDEPIVHEHVWGEYVSNNDATTEKDGTKTRTCSECGETETVTDEGSKLTEEPTDPSQPTDPSEPTHTHNWGAYVSDGNATVKADGTKTRTCKDCGETETVTDKGSKQIAKKTQKALDKEAKVKRRLGKLYINWGAVKGADGYSVYVGRCDKKVSAKLVATKEAGKTSAKVSKLNGSKISNKGVYYVIIKAYKLNGSKKIYMGKSSYFYNAGYANKTYTNAKKVTVKATDVSVKVGKTATISSTTKKINKNEKLYKAKRYWSDNEDIATVSGKGVITGVSKGSCTVYVMAANGLKKAVKVTVK